ncbi:S8 family serine peptidase, partial [Streptomyces sp. NPDC059718]
MATALAVLILAGASPVWANSGSSHTSSILGENSGAGLPGHYIVRLKNTLDVHGEVAQEAALSITRKFNGKLGEVWDSGLLGFTVDVNSAGAKKIAGDPRVSWVEEQQTYHVESDQTAPPNRGLDRIDQRSGFGNSHYLYPAPAASGVHVYIVDSGIRTSNPEFEGRATYGTNTTGGDPANADDCAGHGTKVAGIVGSKDYGVAKKVSLVSVKVFGCSGTGAEPQVVNGLKWVETHAIKPAIVNLSLGPSCANSIACPPGTSQSIVDEEQALLNLGIPVVTAAGNDDSNACFNPVGATPGTINVGATLITDDKLGISSWGPCVDIWAPGGGITSVGGVHKDPAGVLDPDPINDDGTSFAAPHVAGAVALLMGTPQFANATPAQISAQIDANATLGKLSWAQATESPNKLLYIPSIQEGSSVAVAKISSGTLSGALEAFGADAGGKMLFASQTAANAGSWTNWTPSVQVGWLSTGADNNADGTIELIGVTPSNQVWQRQSRVGTPPFTNWSQLTGPPMQSVAVTHNKNGLVEL